MPMEVPPPIWTPPPTLNYLNEDWDIELPDSVFVGANAPTDYEMLDYDFDHMLDLNKECCYW